MGQSGRPRLRSLPHPGGAEVARHLRHQLTDDLAVGFIAIRTAIEGSRFETASRPTVLLAAELERQTVPPVLVDRSCTLSSAVTDVRTFTPDKLTLPLGFYA